MYIKNRRNSNKFKAFDSHQTLCLTESLMLRNPTFHILSVVRHFKKLQFENEDFK